MEKRRVEAVSEYPKRARTAILMASPESEDSAMSAFDRAMASYQGSQGEGGQVQEKQEDDFLQAAFNEDHYPSEQQESPDAFVASHFNNPMYNSQARQQANDSWANNNAQVSTGTELAQPAPRLDHPVSASGEENLQPATPSAKPASSEPESNVWTQHQSFIDALRPNSEDKKEGLVAPAPSTDSEADKWEPLLTFTVKNDEVEKQQEAQSSTATPTAQQQSAVENPTHQQRPKQPPSRMYVNQPPGPNAQQTTAEKPPPQQQGPPPPPAAVAPSSHQSTAPPKPQQGSQAQTPPQPPAVPQGGPSAEQSTAPQKQQQNSQAQTPPGKAQTDTAEAPPKLNDMMSTAWEDDTPKKGQTMNPFKDFMGGKPQKKTARGPTFTVKPGVTKRILQSMDKTHPRPYSHWEAFRNAEKRWSDLKSSRKFRYDFKLFRSVQDGAGPPLQFVSDDCARGNAKCCAKLRAVCEQTECTDLDYEGPELDDFGQPIMDYDVVILGGTLGIFYGMALQLKGLKVCVVSPRDLKGQDQEWNVAKDDLLELQRLSILSSGDIDACVTTVFDGTRVGFKNREVTPLTGGLRENEGTGFECYLNGVLNLGVSPRVIIERTARNFKAIGGVVRERCPLGGVAVSPQVGCAVDLGSYNPDEQVEPITAKLVLDCMGYGSPVARQQRYGQRPDSMCMVFGSSAGGYNADRNRFADAMYSFNGLQDFGSNGNHQYFWETFPVGTKLTPPQRSDKEWFDKVAFGNLKDVPTQGQVTSDVKTTYMFTYIDANKKRPSLESLMDDYFKLLPEYQKSINNPEKDLQINRVLYDYFPAYRDSPMKPQHSRVLSVGEASGLQSPISFGGFRSLSRHIGRVSGAVAEAVETGCLHKDDLGEINAYLPNLSAAWLFRDIMSVSMRKSKTQDVDPKFPNRVLAVYMKAMSDAGPRTVSPLMHDVLRFDALATTLVAGIFADPLLMGELVKHVGPSKLSDFLGHVAKMGIYSLLDTAVAPIMEKMMDRIDDPRTKFQMRRRMENWKYGSGNDYN